MVECLRGSDAEHLQGTTRLSTWNTECTVHGTFSILTARRTLMAFSRSLSSSLRRSMSSDHVRENSAAELLLRRLILILRASLAS